MKISVWVTGSILTVAALTFYLTWKPARLAQPAPDVSNLAQQSKPNPTEVAANTESSSEVLEVVDLSKAFDPVPLESAENGSNIVPVEYRALANSPQKMPYLTDDEVAKPEVRHFLWRQFQRLANPASAEPEMLAYPSEILLNEIK